MEKSPTDYLNGMKKLGMYKYRISFTLKIVLIFYPDVASHPTSILTDTRAL